MPTASGGAVGIARQHAVDPQDFVPVAVRFEAHLNVSPNAIHERQPQSHHMRPVILPFAVSLLAFFGAAGSGFLVAKAEVLAIRNRPPMVSFDIHVSDENGTFVMPPPPLPRLNKINADGFMMIDIGGTEHYHIASISGQASGMENSDLDTEAAFKQAPTLTANQKRALDWLDSHRIDLANGASVWHNSFDHAFNDLIIKAGWPSAFAQADLIKTFMLAWKRSGEDRYLDLARRAAYGFTVPCEEAGLRCEVGGKPWFAEVPLSYGYAPMILNGHLYSLVMLHRFWKATGDVRVKAAFDEGFTSARELLLNYDTGYWTVYQARPRLVNAFLVLEPTARGSELREVSISSAFSRPSSILFGSDSVKTYPANVAWGGLGSLTKTGQRFTDELVSIQIAPGRLVIDHDPVHFEGFEITVRYAAPDCASLRVGTFDWRAGSTDYMVLPMIGSAANRDGCVARFSLPTRINQWSHLSPFYHDWHTKLVTELWRITGDAHFYATAIRWRRYAEEQERHGASKSTQQILQPIFDPQDSSKDDEAILHALNGADPAKLAEKLIRTRILDWAEVHKLSKSHRSMLLARVGLRDIEPVRSE